MVMRGAAARSEVSDVVLTGINMRCVQVPAGRGRLLRGGGPAFTREETVRELVDVWGLQTVLDLRSDREVVRDGGADTFVSAGVDVRSVPLTGYDSTPINAARPRPEDFVPYYLGMMQAEGWSQIFHALATAADRPLMLMCACGKDRTGVVTALALSLADVPDDVVAADYALTRDHLPRDLDHFADKWLRRGHTRDDWVVRANTQERTMLAFLARLREQHGSVRSAVVASGASPDDIDLLRQRWGA